MIKIMLVEDDKSLREIYSIRLVAEGYNIVSAGDGEEALALAVKEKPDLIIADVMMPKISGFDMLDILRSTPETSKIKVIMMTALSSDDQRQRGEALGAERYLVKSQVGIEDVINTVHEVLEDKPNANAKANIQTLSGVQPAPAAPVAGTATATQTTPASTPAPATAVNLPQPAAAPSAPTPIPVTTENDKTEGGSRVIEPITDSPVEQKHEDIQNQMDALLNEPAPTPETDVGPASTSIDEVADPGVKENVRVAQPAHEIALEQQIADEQAAEKQAAAQPTETTVPTTGSVPQPAEQPTEMNAAQ